MMRKVLALALFGVCAFAADISGTWSASVETDAGSGNPTFVLKQSGEQITGSYSGALGEAKVTGTVKGAKVEFSFGVSPNGEELKCTYTGSLETEKKMKGTVKLGSLGTGTFTATRN